eukprot:SAG11_NODE_2999_length_2778_cov_23.766331_1_plen_101_part_00
MVQQYFIDKATGLLYQVNSDGIERLCVPDKFTQRQTNNTAELLGLVMALLWLWFVDETTEAAILLVDSLYAGNAIQKLIKCTKNKALVAWGIELLARTHV